jgi:hypothetical protein
VAIVVRTLAFAALAVFSAGAIYSAGALAINAAGDRLSPGARVLCWRILAVKLAGVALITITLATSASS